MSKYFKTSDAKPTDPQILAERIAARKAADAEFEMTHGMTRKEYEAREEQKAAAERLARQRRIQAEIAEVAIGRIDKIGKSLMDLKTVSYPTEDQIAARAAQIEQKEIENKQRIDALQARMRATADRCVGLTMTIRSGRDSYTGKIVAVQVLPPRRTRTQAIGRFRVTLQMPNFQKTFTVEKLPR